MSIYSIPSIALLLLFSSTVQSQTLTKEECYQRYAALVGGQWESKGNWENGSPYHQKIKVEKALTEHIFTVKTHDYIDSRQFDRAQRNYGIRAWDEQAQQFKFWEFDVFGGVISGEIRFDQQNIYHVYSYPTKNGETLQLADAWIYVDKNTYRFKVCAFENGQLGKEYMTAMYKRKR